MPSRNIPGRADAAKEAPIYRAYRWSSGTQPRTKPSVGALCCEALCPPSAIPGADSEHTADVPAQSIREHSGSRTADTQNRPANGRQTDTLDTPLQWRTVTGIRAGSSEMLGAARTYTIPWGLLKQPDKQKISSLATEYLFRLLCSFHHTRKAILPNTCIFRFHWPTLNEAADEAYIFMRG